MSETKEYIQGKGYWLWRPGRKMAGVGEGQEYKKLVHTTF